MKIKAFGNLDLKLEILPVKSLIIHEQIIPNKAKMLKFQIINWAKLKNPIIVDENNIVLDGNHRATIFKKLGFRNICVCKIDYFNKSIKLKYWFRLIKNFSHFPFLSNLIARYDGKMVEVSNLNELKHKCKENKLAFGFINCL